MAVMKCLFGLTLILFPGARFGKRLFGTNRGAWDGNIHLKYMQQGLGAMALRTRAYGIYLGYRSPPVVRVNDDPNL